MFVGVKASEIVEGCRYDVLYKVHKAQDPQPFPGIVLALGNKSICDEQLKLHNQKLQSQKLPITLKSKSTVVTNETNKEIVAFKSENEMLKRRVNDLEDMKDRAFELSRTLQNE